MNPFLSCLATALVVFTFSTSPVRAVPGDEHWDTQFGWPGPGANVSGIAVQNGLIYAGGLVSNTNAVIETWNGLQWSPFAQLQGSIGQTLIYDMAFVGNTFYVTGLFTNINGQTITNFAKWDGTSWSSMGLNGFSVVLVSNGNNLYVGGAFTNVTAEGVMATNIAYWDGSAWHALGSGLGITSGSSFGVNAIAFNNGLIYAGGLFTNSGSMLITNLAVWNGNSWSAVGGGVNNLVYALAFNGSALVAGGLFSQAGTNAVSGIAQWDGSNWSSLGGGLAGGSPFSYANRIAIFNSSVYASGNFTSAGGVHAVNVASWNGSTWSPLGTGVNSSVARLFPTATNILAGGNILQAGGIIANGFAAWDGSNWHTFGTPGRMNGISSTVQAVGGNGTNLLIGGQSFSGAGQTNAVRIARFDGNNFYPIGPGLNSNVVAVAAVGTNYYAAGLFTGNGNNNGPLANILAHWDGTNWSWINNTPFAKVNQLAVSGNNLFIAGYFGVPASDSEAWWLARWDGTNLWNGLKPPAPPVTLSGFYSDGVGFSALAVQGTNIYVSGQFYEGECDSSFNCTNCEFAAYCDGTYTWPMGTGLNTNATAIAIVGTNVYFAGQFVTNAGGVTVSQIARWNGTAWTDVGGGVVGKGVINALAAIGTNLYAGGSFTNIGGVTATRIAKWDGNTWSALGSGVSSSVFALGASGNDLYVGGFFKIAGTEPSYYLARWNDRTNFETPQLINPVSFANGQFRVRLEGVSSQTNIVQATTNFVTWTPVLTNTVGIYDFIDSNAANYPYRFYRAVLGP